MELEFRLSKCNLNCADGLPDLLEKPLASIHSGIETLN
jgi:hypothetical protein